MNSRLNSRLNSRFVTLNAGLIEKLEAAHAAFDKAHKPDPALRAEVTAEIAARPHLVSVEPLGNTTRGVVAQRALVQGLADLVSAGVCRSGILIELANSIGEAPADPKRDKLWVLRKEGPAAQRRFALLAEAGGGTPVEAHQRLQALVAAGAVAGASLQVRCAAASAKTLAAKFAKAFERELSRPAPAAASARPHAAVTNVGAEVERALAGAKSTTPAAPAPAAPAVGKGRGGK